MRHELSCPSPPGWPFSSLSITLPTIQSARRNKLQIVYNLKRNNRLSWHESSHQTKTLSFLSCHGQMKYVSTKGHKYVGSMLVCWKYISMLEVCQYTTRSFLSLYLPPSSFLFYSLNFFNSSYSFSPSVFPDYFLSYFSSLSLSLLVYFFLFFFFLFISLSPSLFCVFLLFSLLFMFFSLFSSSLFFFFLLFLLFLILIFTFLLFLFFIFSVHSLFYFLPFCHSLFFVVSSFLFSSFFLSFL